MSNFVKPNRLMFGADFFLLRPMSSWLQRADALIYIFFISLYSCERRPHASKLAIVQNALLHIPYCTCPDFTKMSSQALGKKEMSVLRTSLSCVQICVQDLWITRMTTSFTLQPTPATSSYGYNT
jgi:hypothetical protein